MKYSWLYLESFVFIWCQEEEGVIYNSHFHKCFIFKNVGLVKNKVAQLNDILNMYCIKISDEDLLDMNFKKFVSKIQATKSGGLLEASKTGSKPVFLVPRLKLQRDFGRSEQNEYNGQDIKTYIHEISIYVNGKCDHNCNYCSIYFRQVPFCTKTKDELKLTSIIDFLSDVRNQNLHTINIFGGNINEYRDLCKLIEYLNKSNCVKIYHLNYLNILSGTSAFKKLQIKGTRLQVLINFPIIDIFDEVVQFVEELEMDVGWTFVITSEDEFYKTEELIERNSLTNFEIKPIYNFDNYAFFQENVFLSRQDILSTKASKNEIFAREVINRYDFGRLIILSSGKIFANVNQASIGDICSYVNELLYNELVTDNSWRRTRNKIEPCKKCIFWRLCPSPSNYEQVIV